MVGILYMCGVVGAFSGLGMALYGCDRGEKGRSWTVAGFIVMLASYSLAGIALSWGG